MNRFIDNAVESARLVNLPVGETIKVSKCEVNKLIGTLIACAIINSFSPMRFLCQYNTDNMLLTITKLSESALRDDGSDYLDRKE